MSISTTQQLHSRHNYFLAKEPCPRCRNIPYKNLDVYQAFQTGEKAKFMLVLKKYREVSLTEIKCSCGKVFTIPKDMRAPKQQPARKVNKEYLKMDEEALIEVGLGDPDYRQLILDFLWAVRSELRIISQNQFHRREDYLVAVGQGYLDFKQMKEDLDSILRGDKTVEDACTKENIRNNILRRDDFHLDWNTDTLFCELPKLYRREFERHQKAGRSAIDREVEQSVCCVTPKKATKYLNYSYSSEIRRLRRKGVLIDCKKHSTKGKAMITVDSLIKRKRG